MGLTLRLMLQFLNNLTKWRMNIRKVSIFAVVLILLYIFILFSKDHHGKELKVVEYTERLLRKNTSLRTRLQSVQEPVSKLDVLRIISESQQQVKNTQGVWKMISVIFACSM